MKIYNINPSTYNKEYQKNFRNITNKTFLGTPRVDKGLARFAEANALWSPDTFKKFMATLEDKSRYTPVEALKEAFKALDSAKTVQDVKDAFPNEKLFNNLKRFQDTKATDGLLYIYREFKELYKDSILKNGEDLSIYLLKKIFHEAKTRKEINEDIKNDLDGDIIIEFKHRYPDREFIPRTLLTALGIKRPDPRFQQSIIYTKDGVSDERAEAQSEAQKNAWRNLTLEQKNERIKKIRENYKNFLAGLTEEEKASRLRIRVNAWQELSPEERTELIDRIREANEPFRYAMIDAWNHSEVLIHELSEFLKSQQGLKPIDLLYTDKKFIEFQSIIMTEFWDTHRDLASEFGKTLKSSLEKVKSAINEGQFWKLKKEIESDKDKRIKMFKLEKLTAEQKASEPQNETPVSQNYQEAFKNAYKQYIDKDRILPPMYIDEIVNTFLENYSKDIIEKLTEVYNTHSEMLEDLAYIFGNNKVIRLQRALETAIAQELYYINHNPEVFAMEHDSVIDTYRQKRKELPINKYPDTARIQKFYNEYKKDLTDKQLNNIVKRYFTYKTNEDEKMISDYVKLYGQTALILFSDKSAFPDDVKIKFNEKFLKLMPEEIKKICVPVFSSSDDITAERSIKQIKDKFMERYNFMPEDFLQAYTHELIYTIHLYSHWNKSENNIYSIKSFEENICKKQSISDDNNEYHNTYINIPKMPMLKENKIKVLAAEQALADELFRVTGNEKIYELEIEQLMNMFEAFSIYVTVLDQNGNIEFEAKEDPNKYYVRREYKNYLDELNREIDNIFDNEGCIKDSEKLSRIFNPESGNEPKNEYIKKRLNVYIEGQDSQDTTSILDLKNSSESC